MFAQNFISFVTNFFPWGFTKVCILILILIYIVFASVLLRQERLMAKVVEIPYVPFLRILAIGHLLISIFIFLLALIII